jgi:hypothetical protein
MKKSTIVGLVVLAGLALFLGSLRLASAQRPGMPVEWSRLYRGMTPEEVRSRMSDEIYDLRAVQGFDLVIHKNKYGHWQLLIRYDSAGRVVSATANYIHTFGFGLLNSSGKRIL